MKFKGILFTMISAIIFGFTPILADITYTLGNNSLSMTFYRNLFAVPFLFFILKYKKISLKINKNEFKDILIISIFGVALTTVLLYSSYSYIGVGVATTLHFTFPIFVALACRFIFKEKLCKNKIIALITSFIGILFFMEKGSSSNILGVLMALISGVTYAFYIVYLEKKKLININSYKLLFYIALFVSIAMFLGNLFYPYIVVKLCFKAYLLMFIVSILASVFGVLLLKIGISIIGSTSAAIFSLFEPITSLIFGVLLLNENLNLMKIIGSLIIFISITYLALNSKQTH